MTKDFLYKSIKYFGILILAFSLTSISTDSYSQSHKYSIDKSSTTKKKRKVKVPLRVRIIKLFKKDPQEEADKEKAKKEKEQEKNYKDNVEKYQESRDGKITDISTGETVYDRMKKNKKKSDKRMRKSRIKQPWYKRIFRKRK